LWDSARCLADLLLGPANTLGERLDHAIAQNADFINEAREQVQGLRTSTVEANDLARARTTCTSPR
jgi:hypothetical protein